MLHWWRVDGTAARQLFPLQPSINVEHEAGQVTSTVFQIFGMTRTGIEPKRLPLAGCMQA